MVTDRKRITFIHVGLSIRISAPRGLDAPAKSRSPKELGEDAAYCWVGELISDSLVEMRFTVHVGARTANGTVTAQVSDGTYPPLDFVAIPAIKIIGSPKEH